MWFNSPHYVGSNWSSNECSYNWDAGLIYSWNAGLSSAFSHWDDARCGPRDLHFGIAVVLRCRRRALLRRRLWAMCLSFVVMLRCGLRAPRLGFAVMLRCGLQTPRLGFTVMLSNLASWHCINNFYQPCVWSMSSAFDDLSSVIFR